MVSNLEQKVASKQQRLSKIAKERFRLSQSHGPSKHHDKFKGKICIDPMNNDNLKGKLEKEEELVKYMDSLPGYLQSLARGENFHQRKVLSFGVLDWERLENWKTETKESQVKGYNIASSSGFTPLAKTIFQSSSSSSSVSMDDLAFQEYECASRGKLDQKKKTSRNGNPFGLNYSEVFSGKGRRTDAYQTVGSGGVNLSSNMRSCGTSMGLKENSSFMDIEIENTDQAQELVAIKERRLDKSCPLIMRASSSNLSRRDISHCAKEKTGFRNDEQGEDLQGSVADLSYLYQVGKPQNIVVLQPKEYAHSSHPQEHQTSIDEILMDNEQENFSADFSHQEFGSSEFSPQIPHSCPLPFSIESNSVSEMMPRSTEILSREPQASESLESRKNVERYCSEPCNTEARNQSSVGNTSMLDQEVSEANSRKERLCSHNQRFSFSFSQMGRSFSFKEGSSAPQFSPPYVSVKSGPLRSDGSAYGDDSIRKKSNGHNRARSSPLRRILDPLLKSKSEKFVPSKGVSSSSSNPKAVIADKSLENEKQASSTIRALLQFTVRNGIHLFQFVIDNKSDVLAAAMKNPTSSEKGDSTRFYTLYSVNEVKKRIGSWISHGNKDKNNRFAYNIIGQMQLHSSVSSDNHYMVKESVLFDVDSNHADQSSKKSSPRGELAAVVIRTPRENMFQDDHHLSDPCMMDDNCFSTRESEENRDKIGYTTIILPGGVHSLPKDGVLSPLIDRWKSGGSCDCGGWDIGCKLRILANQKEFHRISKSSRAHLNTIHSIQFFDLEGDQHHTTVFNLVPLNNGFYSVEFHSTISPIQALFISVTVISFEKSCRLSEDSNSSETKVLEEPGQIRNDPSRKMPVKYASNPPPSPVGRV